MKLLKAGVHGGIDFLVASSVLGERRMSAHKFAVGQTVRFSPDRNQQGVVRGAFTVVRLLPDAASILQYRVKSQMDGHERVVREDQLTRS